MTVDDILGMCGANNRAAVPIDLGSPSAEPFVKAIAQAIDDGRISVRRSVSFLDLQAIEDLENILAAHGIACPFDL